MSIKLYWSRGRGKNDPNRCNFGDWMSPLIVGAVSGRSVEFASPEKCDLFAIGSILNRSHRTHRFYRLGLLRPVDIWGSGCARPETRVSPKHRYHALRGKFSEGLIQGDFDQHLAYGDPGLLCELLLHTQVAKPDIKYEVGLVPHYRDQTHPLITELSKKPGFTLINVFSSVDEILSTVQRCRFVLSSSMHGLIVADALGVPNGWLELSDQITGGHFKFRDYYSCFGIKNPQPLTLTEGDSVNDIASKLEDYSRPGIENIKMGLQKSFPL